jgi:glycosyltransferase involved in cell wall biosynthesis
MKLTIGMATYKDYDGVYFTLQALKLYHNLTDVELLVVDNFGCDNTADACEKVGATYIRDNKVSGTSAPRDRVFREARGEAVMCIDSHILIAPGAVERLIEFYKTQPHTMDLYQGPLVWDSHVSAYTHFDTKWQDHMWGVWAVDPRVKEDEPFEIPMQGLGLFTCRKEAWLGFNPKFRGFGGEEGYIHLKYRKEGRNCWCLPWLKWVHRFQPKGTTTAFPLRIQDRIYNYIVGFDELGLPLRPIYEHFMSNVPAPLIAAVASEALGRNISITFKEEPADPAKPAPQVNGERTETKTVVTVRHPVPLR